MTSIALGSPLNPRLQRTGRMGPVLRAGAGLLEAKQWKRRLMRRWPEGLQLICNPLGGRAHVPPSADAVFIGGNGLRAIGAIQRLERKLRRPVLTANQVLLWQALRQLGVAERVARYGRVYGFAARRG